MSSRVYTPDKWLLLRMKRGDDAVFKVLGSWYGDFTRGDSWRLSSGVVRLEREGDKLRFHNHSGSVYEVYATREGASLYTEGVLAAWVKNLPPEAGTIARVTLEQYQRYPDAQHPFWDENVKEGV